jgi:hypothetical protein
MNYLLLQVSCLSLILVKTLPKINLKSYGICYVEQLNLLSLPVCDRSSLLKRAYNARVWSYLVLTCLGSYFYSVILFISSKIGMEGMSLTLLYSLTPFSDLLLVLLLEEGSRLAIDAYENSLAFYLLVICSIKPLLSLFNTFVSLSFISSSLLDGKT